jgi:hypothetical protein
LWNAFVELHEGRGSNGYGPNPITWQDLAAWQSISGVTLTAWEVSAIRALDSVALAAAAKQAAVQTKA